MFTDYQCSKCNSIFDVKKLYGEDWPKKVKCPNCGKKAGERIYNKAPLVDVAEGKVGNAKNGYQSTVTYQPSTHTPNSISRKRTGTDNFTGSKFGGYDGK